jgi:peptidoglycan/LPS O-acetylase OafA/YrhL
MMLSGHEKFEIGYIFNFYFRRIRRIVPIYLFVLFVFQLTAILFWLSPLDYREVYLESTKSLYFTSNINNDFDYFDKNMVFYRFLPHLWTVAVEMQFYLIVPFLVFVLSYVPKNYRLFLIILIAAASLYYQANSVVNIEHMALSSRLWQFMFGFIAFYLSEIKIPKKIGTIQYSMPTILLIAFLIVPIFESKVITRLILLSSTVILLTGPDFNYILCNKFLAKLGDVSYSVYIVHWPIFEWYRYWDLSSYLHEQKTSILVSIILIIVSITLGYFIEKGYRRIRGRINNWVRLIPIISMLYLMLFASMWYLKTNGKTEQVLAKKIAKVFAKWIFYHSVIKFQDLIDAKMHAKLANETHIENKLLEILHNKDKDEIWSADKVFGYNQAFQMFAWNIRGCQKVDKSAIPTKFDLNSIKFSATCQLEGRFFSLILKFF